MSKIKLTPKAFEPLDDEEKALMEAIEKGETQRDLAEEKRIKKMKFVIGGPVARNVTIHMQQEDIDGMKKKAAEAGIPYQTLINSIIHRYLNGGIILKNAI